MTWNLHNIKGSRATVKATIGAQANIPADVKAFLSGQVDSLPAGVEACRLDAYCQDVPNPQAMTITQNMQITLVGITL